MSVQPCTHRVLPELSVKKKKRQQGIMFVYNNIEVHGHIYTIE